MPAIVLTAPYKGTTVSYGITDSKTGCSHVKVVTQLSFRTTTGVGRFDVRASAPACSGHVGNTATSRNWFTVYVPIRTTTGAHSIIANWTIAARGSEHLAPGLCAGGNASGYWTCVQNAISYLDGYAYLADAASHNTIGSANAWAGINHEKYNFSGCAGPFYGCGNYSTGANASFSVHTSFSWWINATLSHSHLYYLVMVLYGGALAEVEASGSSISGGLATAAFDLASGTNGANLTSITVR